MPDSLNELVQTLLPATETLLGHERHVLRRFLQRMHVSRDTNRVWDESLTFGQWLADRVAAFGGSWTFIILFGAILIAWVLLNSVILVHRGRVFDPYPYILLNLVLSSLAALQAPVIMMSQNRQASKDRLQAEHDYEVNLKAELEILGLHQKIDTLREEQWRELVAMQQEQIRLLAELLARRIDGTTPTTRMERQNNGRPGQRERKEPV